MSGRKAANDLWQQFSVNLLMLKGVAFQGKYNRKRDSRGSQMKHCNTWNIGENS